jgi:hypothetical protein
MRISLLLIAVIVLAACGDNAAPVSGSRESSPLRSEIPPSAGSPARACNEGGAYFSGTPLAHREGWYGRHLRVLGEQPFCANADETFEAYRLTWLPSFHPSVIVRIERSSGPYHLAAKVESGAGGYEPGHLARDTSFTLAEADGREFVRLLNSAHFWARPTEPPPDRAQGADGAQWILEGLGRNRYHVVDRWSPDIEGPDAPYRRLLEWMLSHSGLAAPELVREY